jgi:hypothetical protein
MPHAPSERDWDIRLHIYRVFVEQGRPPTCAETAGHFGIADDEARAAYHRLHDAHALFLEPGTDDIRIANPLSAVPTAYQVHVNDRMLYANCAWDSLGIPAMLRADAVIDATDTLSGDPVRYRVEAGRLIADGGLVHFPLPFRRWYDDLIHT